MKSLRQNLINWYTENRRELPWRFNRDAYRIWISEVMLQQTTVAAVIPFYERFMNRFPKVEDLAKASLEDVFEHWAGLGYYSRARNLHSAAQALAAGGFPQNASELLKLPGFGPYTARAVSSLAFSESVGVLDGNVIRVLTRVFGLRVEWWTTNGRNLLQEMSDELSSKGPSEIINQGMMELGATICTPRNPLCMLCPWKVECVARKQNLIAQLPLKKPRKDSEIWVWMPELQSRQNRWAVIENDYTPFLKGQWIFPGTIKKSKTKPKYYDLKHGITHHQIYIQLQKPKKTGRLRSEKKKIKWVSSSELKKISPSSVLQKILALSESAVS